MTVMADMSHPGSQGDVINHWQPVHSLMEDVVSGAKTVAAPRLLALAVAHLPPGREGHKEQLAYSPLVFARTQFIVL